MGYEKSVFFTGDYVEVHSVGEKSYQTAVELWTEVTRVCEENNCFKVLGIGKSTKAMPTLDAVKHDQLFEDFKVDRTYKIAWVELNPEAVASVKFIETVLLNRGMHNGILFDNVEDAKNWLLDDSSFFDHK